jgi:hypothetical protein
MRKKAGLTPSDIISLSIQTDENGQKLIQKFETEIKKTVLAKSIEFKENNEPEIKIGELVFKIAIHK